MKKAKYLVFVLMIILVGCGKEEETKVPNLIQTLYEYVLQIDHLPSDMQQIAEQEGIERAACDYIAGMTDHFAVALFQKIVVPKSWGI